MIYYVASILFGVLSIVNLNLSLLWSSENAMIASLHLCLFLALGILSIHLLWRSKDA